MNLRIGREGRLQCTSTNTVCEVLCVYVCVCSGCGGVGGGGVKVVKFILFYFSRKIQKQLSIFKPRPIKANKPATKVMHH